MRATAVGVAGALVWTLTAGPASASPDWNLGNTGISQSYNLNAQASGPIANPGLGKCLDDPAGNTANGTAVASSACTGAVHQNWTFTPYADYTDEGSFHGTVTPVGAPGKCLDVTSTNGGAAKSVAVGGSVQMLMTTSGELYAKNSAGMGGWTKESDFELEQIAAGSDGTQMMVPGDGSVYARNTVGGASGWTSEGGVSAGAIATNGGVQLYLGRDGTVYARNGIGPAAGWVAESAPGATAISVGSDGTQMMMAADGTVYARNSIGAASGWVKEVAPGTKAIVTNGGVQILIGSDGYVYAKSGIGMGGWTPEGGIAVTNPTSSFPIAAGSDGTQLKLGTDGYLYAQKGIGLNRWTKEAGPLNTSNYAASIAAGAGGLQAFILDNGVVNAQTGIAASGSSAESDLSTATVDGSPAQLTDCGGWKSQQWLYQYNQNGGTQLYNPAAQRCLDTPGSSTADGEALQIYACNGTNSQRFIPPSGPAAPNGQIVNASMNKCAIPAATSATPADGTAVVLFGCGVGYTQPSACSSKCPPTGPLLPWTLQSDGSLTAAGLCLGIVGGEGATNDGTKVELAECQESLDQQWVVGYDTGGNPRLVNPNSGRCLDDPGSSVNWGTQLQIYTCNNTGA
ncbi:MAG TPA: ricin-type beta-trefoil lectin domain protein, partial [Actinocrinis sp.]|nr:ricin-type beta-trefoil lectin domain protein [Actinocrinis sp.]